MLLFYLVVPQLGATNFSLICCCAFDSQKFIFGSNLGAFPCPLLLTSIHFLVQWTFSYSLSSMFPVTFGGGVVEDMTWRIYLGTSVRKFERPPCGHLFHPCWSNLRSHIHYLQYVASYKYIAKAFQYRVDS